MIVATVVRLSAFASNFRASLPFFGFFFVPPFDGLTPPVTVTASPGTCASATAAVANRATMAVAMMASFFKAALLGGDGGATRHDRPPQWERTPAHARSCPSRTRTGRRAAMLAWRAADARAVKRDPAADASAGAPVDQRRAAADGQAAR